MQAAAAESQATELPPVGRIAQLRQEVRVGLRELQWREVLLFGVLSGALMSLSFLQGSALSIVAGIVPVGTGLLLGRRVKSHYALHGFVTGLIGAVVGATVLAVLIFLTPLGAAMQNSLGPAASTFSLLNVWAQLAGFTAFSLIAFCTFGTGMAGRTEERNRKTRDEVDTRGGRLEKPGVIRSADDIRGLSLPQLGTYVSTIFKKQGFAFKDYRFIDKDKHLDLWMEHEGEPYHMPAERGRQSQHRHDRELEPGDEARGHPQGPGDHLDRVHAQRRQIGQGPRDRADRWRNAVPDGREQVG